MRGDIICGILRILGTRRGNVHFRRYIVHRYSLGICAIKIPINSYRFPPRLFSHRNHDRFTLTAPGSKSRSRWRLPWWFYPSNGRPTLSYHGNEDRWQPAKPWVYLDTVGIGQEFVLDAGGIPEANVWLRELFG